MSSAETTEASPPPLTEGDVVATNHAQGESGDLPSPTSPQNQEGSSPTKSHGARRRSPRRRGRSPFSPSHVPSPGKVSHETMQILFWDPFDLFGNRRRSASAEKTASPSAKQKKKKSKSPTSTSPVQMSYGTNPGPYNPFYVDSPMNPMSQTAPLLAVAAPSSARRSLANDLSGATSSTARSKTLKPLDSARKNSIHDRQKSIHETPRKSGSISARSNISKRPSVHDLAEQMRRKRAKEEEQLAMQVYWMRKGFDLEALQEAEYRDLVTDEHRERAKLEEAYRMDEMEVHHSRLNVVLSALQSDVLRQRTGAADRSRKNSEINAQMQVIASEASNRGQVTRTESNTRNDLLTTFQYETAVALNHQARVYAVITAEQSARRKLQVQREQWWALTVGIQFQEEGHELEQKLHLEKTKVQRDLKTTLSLESEERSQITISEASQRRTIERQFLAAYPPSADQFLSPPQSPDTINPLYLDPRWQAHLTKVLLERSRLMLAEHEFLGLDLQMTEASDRQILKETMASEGSQVLARVMSLRKKPAPPAPSAGETNQNTQNASFSVKSTSSAAVALGGREASIGDAPVRVQSKESLADSEAGDERAVVVQQFTSTGANTSFVSHSRQQQQQQGMLLATVMMFEAGEASARAMIVESENAMREQIGLLCHLSGEILEGNLRERAQRDRISKLEQLDADTRLALESLLVYEKTHPNALRGTGPSHQLPSARSQQTPQAGGPAVNHMLAFIASGRSNSTQLSQPGAAASSPHVVSARNQNLTHMLLRKEEERARQVSVRSAANTNSARPSQPANAPTAPATATTSRSVSQVQGPYEGAPISPDTRPHPLVLSHSVTTVGLGGMGTPGTLTTDRSMTMSMHSAANATAGNLTTVPSTATAMTTVSPVAASASSGGALHGHRPQPLLKLASPLNGFSSDPDIDPDDGSEEESARNSAFQEHRPVDPNNSHFVFVAP